MMAGMSAARDDIIPFGFALGQTGALVGLNIVGLRRRGVSRARCIVCGAPIVTVLRRRRPCRADRGGGAGTLPTILGRQNHCLHARRQQAPADAAAHRSGADASASPTAKTKLMNRADEAASWRTRAAMVRLPIICGGGSFPGRGRRCSGGAWPPAGHVRHSRLGRPAGDRPLRASLDRDRTGGALLPSSESGETAAKYFSSVRFCGRRSKQLRLDWHTIRLMPRVIRSFRGGDDKLLSGIAGVAGKRRPARRRRERRRARTIRSEGVLGRHRPLERDRTILIARSN